ncbi:MAG: carboxypeptidase regulatory-like domain-containing protein [Planctomycetes bacterium]|nr:carboxypeptidase regulatory-like domain-containing protein [Planctomycetota bacterium]
MSSSRKPLYPLALAAFASTLVGIAWWVAAGRAELDSGQADLERGPGLTGALEAPAPERQLDSEGRGSEPDGRVVMPHTSFPDPPRLYIRGSVQNARGGPAVGAKVEASGGEYRFGSLAGEDGRFAVGPLFPGLYLVQAEDNGLEGLARPVTAQAGDSKVELRFRAPAEVHGRIIDGATGEGVSLSFTIHLEDYTRRTWTGFAGEDGVFELHPLLPGRLSLYAIEVPEPPPTGDFDPEISRFESDASTLPTRIATLAGPLELQEGQVVPDVLLVLRPGARVQLELEGFSVTDGPLRARFLRENALVGGGELQVVPGASGLLGSVPNFTGEFLVGTGSLRLELTTADDPRPILRELSLDPGEAERVLLRKSELPPRETPAPGDGESPAGSRR